MAEIIYWLSFALLLGGYLAYPVVIWMIALIFKKNYKTNIDNLPKVSIIISAYNEESVIEDTIKNFLNLDYPRDKMEIIVGSDCSSDSTNDIIKSFEREYPEIVKGAIFTERRGKSAVLNDLVKMAKNDILVFADANTIYQKDALRELVKYYEDSRVGGVCGRLILLDTEDSKRAGNEEKRYWDVESWIKNNEGNLGILIGANGGIYSIRKNNFSPIPTDIPVMDDFFISLKVLLNGKDFVYEKNAKAFEYVAPDVDTEYRRKVRNNAINITSLKYLYKLLFPKYGIISPAFFFHKIARWFSPVLLIILFISNFFVFNICLFYKLTLFGQIIIYSFAVIGWILNYLKVKIAIFNLPFFFVLTNVALMHGILRIISGKNTAYWQSTKRVVRKNNN